MKVQKKTVSSHTWTQKKSRPTKERLMVLLRQKNYLQLAQVHAEPQLQLTHVQFGLLHFTF